MPRHDLKRCPFCGAYGKLKRKNRTIIKGETKRNTYCYCIRCDSRGGRVLYDSFDTIEEAENKAIELWNRRVK